MKMEPRRNRTLLLHTQRIIAIAPKIPAKDVVMGIEKSFLMRNEKSHPVWKMLERLPIALIILRIT